MFDSNWLTDVDKYFLLTTWLRSVAVPHHFAKLFWLFQSGLQSTTAKEPQKQIH